MHSISTSNAMQCLYEYIHPLHHSFSVQTSVCFICQMPNKSINMKQQNQWHYILEI